MESKEQILEKIRKCFLSASLPTINQEIAKLLEFMDEANVSQKIATLFIKDYTFYQSDYFAAILASIIQEHRGLALVNGVKNPFFQMAIFKGSIDLYECYMDMAIIPLLEDKGKDQTGYDFYTDLIKEANLITDACFDNYQAVRKGIHFNGGRPNEEGFITMHQEDYDVMHALYEHFNAIIGRRDILKLMNIYKEDVFADEISYEKWDSALENLEIEDI